MQLEEHHLWGSGGEGEGGSKGRGVGHIPYLLRDSAGLREAASAWKDTISPQTLTDF